jgi:hypothetical protein
MMGVPIDQPEISTFVGLDELIANPMTIVPHSPTAKA